MLSPGYVFYVTWLLLSCCATVSGVICKVLTANSTRQYIKSHDDYGHADYQNKYQACWIVSTLNSSKVVGLKQMEFELEGGMSSCTKDVLTVYNSNTKSGKSIKFCGKDIFTELYSSDRYMYLYLKTNKKTRFKGFRLAVMQYDSNRYTSKLWDKSHYTHPDQDKHDDGLSGGEIAGIVVGSIVGFGLLVSCCKKKPPKPKPAPAAAPKPAPVSTPTAGNTTASTASTTTTSNVTSIKDTTTSTATAQAKTTNSTSAVTSLTTSTTTTASTQTTPTIIEIQPLPQPSQPAYQPVNPTQPSIYPPHAYPNNTLCTPLFTTSTSGYMNWNQPSQPVVGSPMCHPNHTLSNFPLFDMPLQPLSSTDLNSEAPPAYNTLYDHVPSSHEYAEPTTAHPSPQGKL